MYSAARLCLAAEAIIVVLAHGSRAQTPAATITGTVYDSIGGRVLSGARVQFAPANGGRMLTATSDSAGRYRIAEAPYGPYVVGFFDEALDTLGIENLDRPVSIGSPEQRLDLATPSPRTVVAGLCGHEAANDSTALVLGHVRDASTTSGISGATVAFEWTEYVLDTKRQLAPHVRSVDVTTRDAGWFALCGAPTGFALSVRAAHGADSTGALEIALAPRAVAHFTFYVGAARTDSVPGGTKLLRGDARLSGRVVDERGAPVNGASVAFWDPTRTARTNERGAFVLDSLPAGTRTMEVRAIGFAPSTRVVHLFDHEPAHVELTVTKTVVLPTMESRADVVYSRGLLEFERHKRTAAGGYFFRPIELQGTPVQDLRTIVQGAPGVDVRFDPRAADGPGWTVRMTRASTYMRIGDGANFGCTPIIFLDGRQSFFSFDDLDALLDPREILGVEVYPRHVEVPSEFVYDINNPCGALVVWTRPLLRPNGT
ncbi:MAG TPA: carboxypeptidase-like regulatory domain-containing protein [Gemmatimonadaceae bacterium]|nr:carboxypeptidase-like regulatory domain-containing protein [Gemmatimonadaceae bacterium]